ncbi:MAG: small ribosomal subunit Rsm22 family protein, partial [Planctomycetota bacterium]
AINEGYQQGVSGSRFDESECLRAYALYYMSMYLPKLWFMLEHSGGALARLLAGGEETRVTELGCGPGTFLWSLLLYCRAVCPEAEAGLSLQGIDCSLPALDLGRRLEESFAPQRPIEWRAGNWHALDSLESDVVIFGHTLIEGQAPSPERIAGLCRNARMVILIEPGTRQSFHRLLPVRDRLFAEGWHLHFPCPVDAPCPMGTDNWCHFSVGREPLPVLQRIGASLPGESRSCFSAFFFTREPRQSASDYRVLSKLKKAGGRASRWLCSGTTLVEAWLGKKERSETNRPFLKAEAGDLLTIEADGFPSPGRLRKDTTVIGES